MIGRAYRFAQILSIDIVIGVVILLRFFCVEFQVNPGWQVYALLGGTVWLIYTADHLRDSESATKSTRDRYVFHKKHRKKLMIAAILVVIAMIPLLFFIPVVIFLGGVGLAIFSFIYLLVQHRLSKILSKELYVAIVYTAGVLMVPMLLSQSFSALTLVMLFLLTFINLILFSWFEREDDLADGFDSIATQLRGVHLDQLILILLATGLSLAALEFSSIYSYFIIAFAIYSTMFLFPQKYQKNSWYRTIGDGVFLLPIFSEWL